MYQIRTLLDEYIIGQEKLKKILAVAIHNHYQRVTLNSSDHDEVSLDKSNVLLIGPSGTGKTLAAKTIADMLKVPFSINDATSVTQAGYAGDDVESCIARLLQDANYDVAKAERGVVFIDEIDKITRKSDVSNPNQRDVSGEGVQQSLLRILEGTVVNIKVNPGISVGKRPPVGETVAVDTSNILFICSGAFIGLEKIITDRISLKGSIGFGAVLPKNESKKAKESCIHLVEPEDLISYGFIPEFVGRVPVFACTEPLTENELKRILEEPKNALVKQYMKMFKNSDIQLHFHPDAIAKIANLASEKETGARGLRRIMETILQEPLYDYLGTDTKHIVVTPEAVNFDEKVLAFKNTTKANQYLKDNISSERMTPF
ncbi:ATP-dependent Clp protease, ATP-binding subunit ClpX [Globomyces pollinis-pini]|nr:ATP-dependent Clp protease, ATP-binding subunit ClpX [Globomyces pollinis-pini]